MSTEHLLKVPRSESDEYVVVNVKGNGSNPLDLKLVATDGSDVYVAEVKQSKISQLQVKHSPINGTEWESAFSSTLLIQTSNGGQESEPDTAKKLELTASLTESQLTLVVRRNISGITQRLGEISLRKEDDEAIELYEWAAAAADKTSDLVKDIRDLNGKYQASSNTIKKLNEQLEDFIQAKKEHETLLLEKFQALLNAKKLKIRDQQRLLASAKVDPRRAAQIQNARQSQTSRSPTASRPAKRKADGKPPQSSDPESGDSAAFEKNPAVDAVSEAEQETPPQSDVDATTDEDGDDDLDSVPRPDPSDAKGKMMESPPPKQPATQTRSPKNPPPKQLPFAVNKDLPAVKSHKPNETPQDTEGDNSETSDDEL